MRKGRLGQPAADLALSYRESVSFDWRLYRHDIAGSIAEMKRVSPHFDDDVAKIFDVRRSLAQRRAIGAPSPENIAAQIKRWKAKLQSLPCGKRGAGV